MFLRKRNRTEFIVDFPKNDDAEIISSIQVIKLVFIIYLFALYSFVLNKTYFYRYIRMAGMY